MYLCLDLSLNTTGYAKFSSDGKLLEKNSIIPDKQLSVNFKIHYITDRIKLLFGNCKDLIIEDVYLGSNFKGVKYLIKLAGAVAYIWVDKKYKDPKFYMASTARKLCGINARSQKSEIQLWVMKNYGNVDKDKLIQYQKEIKGYKQQKKEWYDEAFEKARVKGKSTKKAKKDARKKSHRKYKYRMNKKLSIKIAEETGWGNDICDAIILGKAFQKDAE